MSEIWSKHLEKTSSYYGELIERYGHDARACDYGRAESQQIKFEVMSQVMPLAKKTVLDVGCGFADFANYLQQEYGQVHYEGIDISAKMIEQAQQLHPELSLQVFDILKQDIGKTYDLVTANGIFYLIQDQPEQHMQHLISRMYALCNRAVAFNALSIWAPFHEDNEFYADPLKTVEFCKTLTPWVVLRHDYMQHDFTIYLYREAKGT